MIIHHISPKNQKKWHPVWKDCYKSFHNRWKNKAEFRLWNDKQGINNLVKCSYPDYYKIYKAFPKHIMRIDFARLCILHKFGGLYADLDVFCYRSFGDKIHPTRFNIVEAPYGDVPVENALMYSPKGYNFTEQLMEFSAKIFVDEIQGKDVDLDSKRGQLLVGLTAGPQMVYNALMSFGKGNYHILDGDLFNNHGLAYSPEFYTKHVLTGVWGKDALCSGLHGRFIAEMRRFGYTGSSDKFDYYTDYTDGNYLDRKRASSEVNASIYNVKLLDGI